MNIVKTIELGSGAELNFVEKKEGIDLFLSLERNTLSDFKELVDNGFTLYTSHNSKRVTRNFLGCAKEPTVTIAGRDYFLFSGLTDKTRRVYCSLCDETPAELFIAVTNNCYGPGLMRTIVCHLKRHDAHLNLPSFCGDVYEDVIIRNRVKALPWKEFHLCEDKQVEFDDALFKPFRTSIDSFYDCGCSAPRKCMVGGLKPIDDEPLSGMTPHSQYLKDNWKPESDHLSNRYSCDEETVRVAMGFRPESSNEGEGNECPLTSPYDSAAEHLADILGALSHIMALVEEENKRSPLITAIDDLVLDGLKNNRVTEAEVQQIVEAVNILKRLES